VFGYSSGDNPLEVCDLVVPDQQASAATFDLDMKKMAKMCDAYRKEGIEMDSYYYIWGHTHPAGVTNFSGVDIDSRERTTDSCPWSVTFIVTKSHEAKAILLCKIKGVRIEKELPIEVDWTVPFGESKEKEWGEEYLNRVHTFPATNLNGYAKGGWPYQYGNDVQDYRDDEYEWQGQRQPAVGKYRTRYRTSGEGLVEIPETTPTKAGGLDGFASSYWDPKEMRWISSYDKGEAEDTGSGKVIGKVSNKGKVFRASANRQEGGNGFIDPTTGGVDTDVVDDGVDDYEVDVDAGEMLEEMTSMDLEPYGKRVKYVQTFGIVKSCAKTIVESAMEQESPLYDVLHDYLENLVEEIEEVSRKEWVEAHTQG